MIDFRYLLTTIVAIFLALAIGLLIGSGLLADELADDLERQVQEVVDRNNELRAEIDALENRIDADEDFGLQVEASLIDGELERESVVLFVFEGTDGALLDRAREAVQLADGSIVTTVTITEKMSMEDASAVAELRADLPAEVEGDLARWIGRELGRSAAGDAHGTAGDSLFGAAGDPLLEHGFIDVDTDREFAIPLSASFVVAAGSQDSVPYDIQSFAQSLLSGLASEGTDVVAIEGWRSAWDFVPTLRDSDVRERVATVDHADTAPGSISMVYELNRPPDREPGHYGFDDGSEGVAPELLARD